ncbi:MAG: hypothetical protein J6U20_13295 [Fibrobacter sp.]|nr:hypothetical protein [Fibrobacter sp.]
MKMIKSISIAVFGIVLCAFFAACGDDNSASTDQHEHFEVEGWNLYWPDWSLAYSVYRGKVDSKHKELHVNANCLSEHLNIKFLDENKKEVAGPKDDEHSLGWEVGDKKILDIEWEGGWGFHLKGVKEGKTTLILKVNHHDHADARTPEISIVVDKALKAEECPFQEDEDED